MFTLISNALARRFNRYGMSMQTKLIVIFLLAKVIPLVALAWIAWHEFKILGTTLQTLAVSDSTASLNDSAVKNIERMTTDTARRVADFLYSRDSDIVLLAKTDPTEENFRRFVNGSKRRLIQQGRWELAADGNSWVNATPSSAGPLAVSTNAENNDRDGFRSRPQDNFAHVEVPLYDEATFIDLNGREVVKAVAANSPKRRHPMNPAKQDVSRRENTYVRAESYFEKLKTLQPGEIFVSDVIGAYEKSNFIGMYTPNNLANASKQRGYKIDYRPEDQAFAGRENPNGRRFEGIVRWATPVTDDKGERIGYVTLALNHDHIMAFVDHITPMDERYIDMPSAYEGNYAFMWDYQCRNICHPRHHSIVGFDPATGEPEIPWLESSIFDGWKKSGLARWTEYVKDFPHFFEQSRSKRPAAELTRLGLVGLDGRFLNNAPQCTGWMDLTKHGGSGSFYILWSGLYKVTTAAAIPYYTGQYAPSEANGFSRRGFGIVTIGSELEYFTMPAKETEAKLTASVDENLRRTLASLILATALLTAAVVLVAIWLAWTTSRPIRRMAEHMSRLAIGDIVGEDVCQPDQNRRDEIGLLARSLHDLTTSRRDELEMANAIATGDYTRTVALRSEMDLLGQALNKMIRINKNALSQVNRAVEQVGRDANSVSDVAASLAQGAQTSESVLKEISHTVDTVDRQAQESVVHAQGANQLAIASRNAAQRGYRSVAELAGSMAEIQQAGKKIATVAKLIDDIAFQTNLLALNASVEAARAGRHGKGFAVVADEVRNLSARSAKAAHETEEMVAAMLTLMESGAKLAGHSDHEFQEIVETTAQVAHLFETISGASREQSRAMSEIAQSLGQIGAVVQKNSFNAKMMATSAGAFLRQAEELRKMVSHFRLEAKPGALEAKRH